MTISDYVQDNYLINVIKVVTITDFDLISFDQKLGNTQQLKTKSHINAIVFSRNKD